MKYYRAAVGEFFAFESDGSQDHLITNNMTRLTQSEFESELAAFIASQPVPVPQVISMRRARLALLGAGMLNAVDAAIANLPDPQREQARIEWEYATEVRRDNALLAALAPGLGLNGAALDQLFIAGGAIP